ncbi:MAG: CoA transferase [Candidatus Rokubacteria bacterium]|nr:CoA transferase [Candidatus Rokubacteria bacterium]
MPAPARQGVQRNYLENSASDGGDESRWTRPVGQFRDRVASFLSARLLVVALPLEGVVVAHQNVAGPFCAEILGDVRAELVKVERPGRDDARAWAPPFWGDEARQVTP